MAEQTFHDGSALLKVYGYSTYNFLFVSIEDKALLKWGYLLKNNCCYRSKFCAITFDHIKKRRKFQGTVELQ